MSKTYQGTSNKSNQKFEVLENGKLLVEMPLPMAFGFDDRLLVNFTVKIRHRTVGPDSSRPDVDDVALLFEEGDFDVSVFSSFFGKDFDPKIIVLMRSAPVIVPVHLANQDDRGRTGSLGLTGHLQFLRRNWLETVSCRR